MERWESRVALVTGASVGIGAAIAESLVKHGMIVIGFARRLEKLQALAKKLCGFKGKFHAFKGDLEKEEDIKAVFEWTETNLKSPVHVLVNNAGFASVDTMLNGTAEDWRRTVDINIVGLSLCTREAIKSMRAHGFDEGHIINIASDSAHSTMTFAFAMYSASKAAVVSITEALRKQLSAIKSKIRVTSVSPGAVNTETYEDLPLPGQMLLPSDIADAIVFILSLRQEVHIPQLTIVQQWEADLKPIEDMVLKVG